MQSRLMLDLSVSYRTPPFRQERRQQACQQRCAGPTLGAGANIASGRAYRLPVIN